MKRVKYIGITIAIIIFIFLTFSQMVYASIDAGKLDQSLYAYYIDPGTGSIIIQVLIGVVVGGVAMLGIYRMRVRNFFSNLLRRGRQNSESGEIKENRESE